MQQGLGSVLAARRKCRADARAHVDLALEEDERLLQGREQPLGDDHGVARGSHFLAQHRELVAPEPRERVARPQRLRHPGRRCLKEEVTRLVTERVVHDLEAVEVDEEHGRVAVAALGAVERER